MKRLPFSLFFLLALAGAYAQTESPNQSAKQEAGGLYGRWSARTSAIQSKQPGWAVPLVTTYTGLFQVVRTDIVRQITPTHTNTWNFDNSKGVNFIPWNNTEFALDLPAYIEHNSTAVDGWGDMSFLGKYRIASGNEQHGTYTVSAFVQATVPTGNYKNGSADASVGPNMGVGKGFGHFDVQSTLGATLPIGNAALKTAGRPIAWNTAAQLRAGKLFWPEIESNATFYKGGTNDGKMQEFITPGILVGKCKLHPENPRSRPGLAAGVGMQIATSHFHTYNHGLILTARWIY
jgi:hypothetical protein